MLVSPLEKFFHQCLVPFVKRLLPTYPTQGFGMPGISAPAFVLCEDIPKAMQFPMLGQQMISA